MMLARKWDRLEMRLSKDIKGGAKGNASPYDIFAHVLADQRPEGVIDDIRDLRRYLILVEAELASSYGLKIKELPKNAENKNKNSVAAAEDSSSSTLMICGR